MNANDAPAAMITEIPREHARRARWALQYRIEELSRRADIVKHFAPIREMIAECRSSQVFFDEILSPKQSETK